LSIATAVLSFIVIEIFADVHRAVFASARPNQCLESQKGKAPSKIKSKRLLKREKRCLSYDLINIHGDLTCGYLLRDKASLSSDFSDV
jgi:hypothetical protein